MAKRQAVKYVITYFGTGMTPKTLNFTREDLAIAAWEAMKDDPYKGASSLTKVITLRSR